MKNILKVSLCGALALLLSACDLNSLPAHHGEFYYSNPTNMPATIVVDQKSYEIAPYSFAMLKLNSGLHTMENEQGALISFMVFDFNEGGILNPAGHVYYALSEVYAKDVNSDRFKPVQYDVMINGYALKMPLKSANALVMGANYLPCSYPIGTPFPEHIVVGGNNAEGNIKRKCFDKPELLTYLQDNYEMDLTPASILDLGQDSISPMLIDQMPQAQFEDEKMQVVATQIIALLEQIKVSNDPKIHQTLNPQFHELILALLEAKSQSKNRSDPKSSQLYNNFIDHVSALRSHSVWVR